MVTCPTSTVVSACCLATAIRAAVTARIWDTPPGAPSTPSAVMVCTESTISNCGRTAATCPSSAARSVSAARNRFSATAPIRSARSRTWAADSSPVTYSTGPDCAANVPASSSRVDLPTPGSPASRTTAPGTRPPPSTRSSSPSPVDRAPAALASTAAIETAGLAGATAALNSAAELAKPAAPVPGRTSRGAAAACTVPHASHPAQRPVHLVVRQPHSEHWNAWPADDFAMGRTVLAGSDIQPVRHTAARRVG